MNREKDQTLAFSVLLTREEYTQTIARIEQENRGRRLPLPTVAGALLTAMGIAGLFFGEAISLSPFAAGCLVLLGLFLACFDGLIARCWTGRLPPGNTTKKRSCAWRIKSPLPGTA